jgi:hypothetical protein
LLEVGLLLPKGQSNKIKPNSAVVCSGRRKTAAEAKLLEPGHTPFVSVKWVTESSRNLRNIFRLPFLSLKFSMEGIELV